MSGENQPVVPQGYQENPDLLPVPASEKKYGTLTFTLMMFSLSACIPMFFLGPIAKGFGLDIWQALIGSFIGNLAAAAMMWLNGIPGVKYGITYAVQLREPFGFKGTGLPLILRAISGAIWYGIEVYVGSLALLMVFLMLVGVPADAIMDVAIRYLPIAIVFYLASLVAVMRLGLKGIGKMADWAGPLILLYFLWLVVWLATSAEFAPNIPNMFVSTTGYFSMGFLTYLAIQTNWWATVSVNISDLSRGIDARNPRALPIGLLFGLIIGQLLGTALGYSAVALTGTVLPQEIILKFAPGLLAVLIGLSFSFLAPWSTDITANAPPMVSMLMSQLKMSWKKGVYVSAIIAFFLAPWWAFGYASGIVDYTTKWAANYGILLGPITGIMVANYWVLRKGSFNVQKLYTYGPDGPWYSNGWSKAAYASLILTWVLCYLIAVPTGQIITVGIFPFPGGIIWYPAIPIALVLYMIFNNVYKEN